MTSIFYTRITHLHNPSTTPSLSIWAGRRRLSACVVHDIILGGRRGPGRMAFLQELTVVVVVVVVVVRLTLLIVSLILGRNWGTIRWAGWLGAEAWSTRDEDSGSRRRRRRRKRKAAVCLLAYVLLLRLRLLRACCCHCYTPPRIEAVKSLMQCGSCLFTSGRVVSE
jgi:hypothetical protein